VLQLLGGGWWSESILRAQEAKPVGHQAQAATEARMKTAAIAAAVTGAPRSGAKTARRGGREAVGRDCQSPVCS
jgi:hypothetical protein